MFDQCDKLGEKISVAVGMPMFRFDISAAKPFVDGDGMAFNQLMPHGRRHSASSATLKAR
jgi:hypothetical protein